MIARNQASQIFKLHDEDKDGKVNQEQAVTLFKAWGVNIYKPKLTQKMIMINTGQDPNFTITASILCTFDQCFEIYNSMQNVLKEKLWDFKYELLAIQSNLKKQLEEPTIIQDRQSRCNIKITVGPVKPENEYCNQIEAIVQKQRSNKVDKNLILTIYVEGKEGVNLQNFSNNLKNATDMLLDLMKGEKPQLEKLFDTLNFQFHPAAQGVEIVAKADIPELKEIQPLINSFCKQIFGCTFQGFFQAKYKFDFDLEAFLSQSSESSLQTIPINDNQLQIRWDTGDIMTGLKKIVKLGGFLDDFQYDKYFPFGFVLLFLLNSEILTAEFQFNNNDTPQNSESLVPQLDQIRSSVLQVFPTVPQMAGQIPELNLKSILQSIGNTIRIQATLGDIQVKFSLKSIYLTKIIANFNWDAPDPEQWS